MEYSVLTIGLTHELLANLKNLITQYSLRCTMSPSTQAADQLLCNRAFHLLIVDLNYLQSIWQSDWLTRIRRNSFVPIIVLSDSPGKDINHMVQLGADICISGEWPCSRIADLAYSQLRRYTEYNNHSDPDVTEMSAFQIGDIFIDPARRTVEVCGQPVILRPREFSLLLYFMRNPKIVLTAEQICEHAWEMEGSYNRGVSGPVALLRKAIEPDVTNPRYIETIPRIGYRFTAYRDETCDDCSSSKVVPIDKLSVVITMILAAVILHEQFTPKSILGCILIGIGTLLMVL